METQSVGIKDEGFFTKDNAPLYNQTSNAA